MEVTAYYEMKLGNFQELANSLDFSGFPRSSR